MGRHSAPDEAQNDAAGDVSTTASADASAEVTGVDASAVLTDDAARGRHSERGSNRSADVDVRQSGRRQPSQSPDSSSTQEIHLPPGTLEAPTGPVWPSQPPDSASSSGLPAAGRADVAVDDVAVDDVSADDGLLPGGFAPEPDDGAAAAEPVPKRPRTGGGDLRLLRRHSDVRARCLAALVVPFIVYFAVQLAIGSSGRQMLLFIFIPLILAGILVGAFLDMGHKKYGAPPHAS